MNLWRSGIALIASVVIAAGVLVTIARAVVGT